MNIAILGYGQEGQAVEKYFKGQNNKIKIFEQFSPSDLEKFNLSYYDLVFRSPSVPPLNSSWCSITKYFFENCPCPIIGVTGTKGKGTTSSIIADVLKSLGKTVHLVGNIGMPAINVLDDIKKDDIVVYELSSFQLWDLNMSPKVSVVLRIEPDHLNVHKDFAEYVSAKSNITKHQTKNDACIYFKDNSSSVSIVENTAAKKIPYPISNPNKKLKEVLDSLSLPGDHNRENAEAALLACASILDQPFEDFINKNSSKLKKVFKNFKGLPHRLEFVTERNSVKFFDDNFATNLASLEVALKAFPKNNLVLITGGRDKTMGKDLPKIAKLLSLTKNLKHVILIGESGHVLYKDFCQDNFLLAETLEEAVKKSFEFAKSLKDSVVIMSPAAASFDMFENAYDRGDQFQKYVKAL